MAGSFSTTMCNTLLDSVLGTTPFAPTTPIKVRLTSTAPTASAAGTEISPGGGYSTGGATITFNAASGGVASNNVVTWTNMTAQTIVGFDLYDSSSTPKRIGGGTLSSSQTTLAGQTFSLPAGAVTVALE